MGRHVIATVPHLDAGRRAVERVVKMFKQVYRGERPAKLSSCLWDDWIPEILAARQHNVAARFTLPFPLSLHIAFSPHPAKIRQINRSDRQPPRRSFPSQRFVAIARRFCPFSRANRTYHNR